MGRGYVVLQVIIIALFTSSYLIVKWGDESRLSNEFVRQSIYSKLKYMTGRYSDLKFRIRGPRQPAAKITILAIDEESLSDEKGIGRWPWKRVEIATIIDLVMQSGAKVLGFDVVFAAKEDPIQPELRQATINCGFESILNKYETDPVLAEAIKTYKDRLVLGWFSGGQCIPYDKNEKSCPVSEAHVQAAFTPLFEKFAIKNFDKPEDFSPQSAPLLSMLSLTSNLPLFDENALYSGSFNGYADDDGVIRGTYPFIIGNGKPYPSLALSMVSVGLQDEPEIKLNAYDRVESLKFKKSGLQIPVSSRGETFYNFLGPSFSFRYVGVMDILPKAAEGEESVLKPDDIIPYGRNKEFKATREELFKDAYVLVGATALGLLDMRNFPFDPVTPGVEGHATAVENMLAGKFVYVETKDQTRLVALGMILLGLTLTVLFQRLSSIPTLLISVGTLAALASVDQFVLFNKDANWTLVFALGQVAALTGVAVGSKYMSEEKQKQFLKNAMGKYVSPAIVNQILKDPSKFALGGQKAELSILFSDIRGFTTFSEKLDAPVLAKLLNLYLGHMTKIICEFHGGTLDKYIGDAIMAFWGAPLPVPDHGAQALQAAIDMQKKLVDLRAEILREYNVEVNVGMGINTGMVSVGNMGSDQNFAYTVLGDHVNTASRIEGLTKYYGAQILTSEFTIDQTKKTKSQVPSHVVVDKVKVKGKETAIDLVQIFPFEPSQEYLQRFKAAQNLYFTQNFQESKKSFEELKKYVTENQKTLPSVSPVTCDLFIERCEEYLVTPPPANWDGSFAMDKK